MKKQILLFTGLLMAILILSCDKQNFEKRNQFIPDAAINGSLAIDENESSCETAFARKTWLPLAHCFLTLDLDNNGKMDFNRWGWTNGPIAEGNSYYDLYAGAGQCDAEKGTRVGRVDVVYSGGTVTVTIGMFSPYTLDETHLYIGNAILPTKNGNFTVAPGLYPYTHDLTSAKRDFYSINGFSGDLYIVLHAVVCGF